MLTRRLLAGLGSAWAFQALVGCTRTTAEAGQSALDRINDAGKIRAGYISYPPSMIVDPSSGAKSGIMVEVMAAMSKSLDLPVEYIEETTWATMIESVEGRRVDVVVTGLWPNARRARRAAFSEAVYFSPVYAYARTNDRRFAGRLASANASGTRIATIDGELSATIAGEDYPAATVVSLPQGADVAQLLLQLTTGKADLTFVESVIARQFMAANPGEIAVVAGTGPVRVFPNTFMVAKDEFALLDALNVALQDLHNSGAVARILQKYDPQGDLFLRVGRPYER